MQRAMRTVNTASPTANSVVSRGAGWKTTMEPMKMAAEGTVRP